MFKFKKGNFRHGMIFWGFFHTITRHLNVELKIWPDTGIRHTTTGTMCKPLVKAHLRHNSCSAVTGCLPRMRTDAANISGLAPKGEHVWYTGLWLRLT
jgi:hypothetical protein